jgi:hypothetical protein
MSKRKRISIILGSIFVVVTTASVLYVNNLEITTYETKDRYEMADMWYGCSRPIRMQVRTTYHLGISGYKTYQSATPTDPSLASVVCKVYAVE